MSHFRKLEEIQDTQEIVKQKPKNVIQKKEIVKQKNIEIIPEGEQIEFNASAFLNYVKFSYAFLTGESTTNKSKLSMSNAIIKEIEARKRKTKKRQKN